MKRTKNLESYIHLESRIMSDENIKYLDTMKDEIRSIFGEEPEKARLAVKSEIVPFDGNILHLQCYYDVDDEASRNYALNLITYKEEKK